MQSNRKKMTPAATMRKMIVSDVGAREVARMGFADKESLADAAVEQLKLVVSFDPVQDAFIPASMKR